MYTNILQVCFVQAYSGLHGSLLQAAHMPELRSGIVAALLEKTCKVLSSCKHDWEFSMSFLIAARALCKPSLSVALLLPSLDNSQLPVFDLRCSLLALAV